MSYLTASPEEGVHAVDAFAFPPPVPHTGLGGASAPEPPDHIVTESGGHRRSHGPRGRRTAAGLGAVLVLGVGAAGLLVWRGSSEEDGGSAGTTLTTETAATTPLRAEDFAAAHGAYQAGNCDQALPMYVDLVRDRSWMESSGTAEQAQAEHDECVDLLAIQSSTRTPAGVLTEYLAFLDERPSTPLEPVVLADMKHLYEAAGSEALTKISCELLGDRFSLITSDTPAAMMSCAGAYRDAARADLALELLGFADDPGLATELAAVVTVSPEFCANLVDEPTATPSADIDNAALLLEGCMTTAGASGDTEMLTFLQIRFLVETPQHPNAAVVEAALIDNAGACGFLEGIRMTDELVAREGFLASKTLNCAQFAHFVGDTGTAIELYQWFLDNTDGDPRTATAEAGLAWNQIAEARTQGVAVWDRPERWGTVSGGVTRLIIRNDAVSGLDVVLTGPETRFLTVEGSPTSWTYAEAPWDCRVDVPVLTVDLIPGVYEVMFERYGEPFSVGTWDLRSGAIYDFCLYMVSY